MGQTKVFSLINRQLVKWFKRVIWPWIIENIWPELRKELIGIFKKVVKGMKKLIFEWLDSRKNIREKAAHRKAAEAEQMARNVRSKSEAAQYNAIAQLWREVAEQFRQENELLKAKLDDAIKKSVSDFQNEMNSMEIKDIIEEGKDASLKLKGSRTILRLPEPSDKS
jgi:hypothetical protein